MTPLPLLAPEMHCKEQGTNARESRAGARAQGMRLLRPQVLFGARTLRLRQQQLLSLVPIAGMFSVFCHIFIGHIFDSQS